MRNIGKIFESKFLDDWKKSFLNSFIYRVSDQVSGYKYTSSNMCDFICFSNGILFLIECKEHKGNTFPLSNLTQYSKLKEKVGIPGVRVGVVIWFSDHDKILYVPISTITKMLLANKKSVNIQDLSKEEYVIYDIPAIKKKVFLSADYSILKNLKEGE